MLYAGPNSTGGLTTNDTEGRVFFRIGDTPYCPRTSASMVWNDGVLDFHVFGWGPVVVRRYLNGAQLVWEYYGEDPEHAELVRYLSGEIERASSGNLKRTWVNNGHGLDWTSEHGEGGEFLASSVEVKTIWVPYGA